MKDSIFINADADFIREKFPEMYYIPITDSLGYNIFSKIHQDGKLKDYDFIKNRRGEVDLTIYSHLISNNSTLTRLIRGNNIELFNINKKTDG